MKVTIKSPAGERTYEMLEPMAETLSFMASMFAAATTEAPAAADEEPLPAAPLEEEIEDRPVSTPPHRRSRVENLFGDKKDWPMNTAAKTPQDDAGDDEGYKGFLLMECEECGKIKGFCARKPITSYRCDDCGHITQLKNLRPAFLKCKCGREYKYKTNAKGYLITYNCLDCGSPVDLELNSRETAYVTVGNRDSRGGTERSQYVFHPHYTTYSMKRR